MKESKFPPFLIVNEKQKKESYFVVGFFITRVIQPENKTKLNFSKMKIV